MARVVGHVRLALGILSAAASALLLVWMRRRPPHEEDEGDDAEGVVVSAGNGAAQEATGDPEELDPRRFRVKSGGMKFARLSRMLEEMDAEREHARPLEPAPGDVDTRNPDPASWDDQVYEEKQTLIAAAAIIRDVRQSEVHRKLPHFQAVDRQLQVIERHLEHVSMSVQSFWRYGRDSPMGDLMALPIMRVAATRGEGMLIPVSLGLSKELTAISDEGCDDVAADCLILGVALAADRDAIESAFRRRSRHFHRHGRCSNVPGFHALVSARNRCLARISAPTLPAYGGGGDLLALYLLAGTDPTNNRYRERSVGILDSVHRGQLLNKLDIIQWPTWDIPLTWGDDDDMIGFGGANHMGASG
mmetsp:Transcript_62779/g.182050  ORF Transcript_62779/g.182050 Transcript_62779/m.182050 type:complete len:361 (+) Transcript_62779:71-1153(+)